MKSLGAAAGWLGSAAVGGWRKSVAAVQESGLVDQIRDNTAALVTKTGEVTQNVVAKVLACLPARSYQKNISCILYDRRHSRF